MITKIDRLSHEFRGITKIDNKVAFISNALPSEVVDIKITKENRNIKEGKVVSYIEKSSDRVEPVCPYYNLCGGCNTSHISYNRSLEYKKEIVQNILNKYANIIVNPEIIFNNELLNYRNKISLKVYNNHLSLVQIGTNNLIKIDNCLLVNKNINNVINILNKMDLSKVNSITIKGTDEIMVIIDGEVGIEFINDLKNYVQSIILNNKVVFGSKYIKIKINDIVYAIYPDSFFQVNTNMIQKLYDKILDYTGKDLNKSILDLYCGAGTISIYLSRYFKKVRGIEVNEEAIKSANLNKKLNKIDNVIFECKPSNQIKEIVEDIVIVDPPRNGLDKLTINKLLMSDVKIIVYVSCNPLTLARDLNILKEKYDLDDITLVDMFPNTYHVESVCVLKLHKPL